MRCGGQRCRSAWWRCDRREAVGELAEQSEAFSGISTPPTGRSGFSNTSTHNHFDSSNNSNLSLYTSLLAFARPQNPTRNTILNMFSLTTLAGLLLASSSALAATQTVVVGQNGTKVSTKHHEPISGTGQLVLPRPRSSLTMGRLSRPTTFKLPSEISSSES
jgi:hypothetical protein